MNNVFLKEVVKESDNNRSIYILKELRYTTQLVRTSSDTIFVFGDNLLREGHGGQAIIRDLPNTYGIRTKKAAGSAKSDYFYDSDFFWFVRVINEDVAALQLLHEKHPIVLHENGYGKGLAKLNKLAPKCYTYLNNALNTFCRGEYFG
jgi:hypothetical protein